MSLVSAGMTLYIGVKILEHDFVAEKARLDSHLVRYESQIIKRDAELARDRLERMAAVDQIVRKLERIEDCIRVRTCTK